MKEFLQVFPRLTVEDDLLSPFLANQLSLQTKRAYRSDLLAFFSYVGFQDPHSITPEVVIAYRNRIARFDEQGNLLNASTVARKLSSLRSFFAYLVRLGILERNPADSKLVRSPKLPTESRTQGLTIPQAQALLEAVDRSTLLGKRDYAILSLMLHLGLRRAEIAAIKIGDFGEARGYVTLTVKGKGSRRRTLPLKPEIVRAIEEYRCSSGRDFASPETPLFSPLWNNRTKELHRPLSTDEIWRIVKKYAKRAGIQKPISPHSLRHTAITLALDAGASYRQVQMMSGHADPKTVCRYGRGKDNLDQNATHYIRL